MKNKIIIQLIFLIILTSGCDTAQSSKISLPTLMCGMCETNIKDALLGIDGIVKVSVDLGKKIGNVSYDQEKISLTEIEKKIADSGYQANEMTANKLAYEKLPKCCKING